MVLNENADVWTSRGRKIGHVDRVIFDPQSGKATHFVVKQDRLPIRGKFIPVDQIDTATEHQVLLHKSAGNLSEFPDEECEPCEVRGFA